MTRGSQHPDSGLLYAHAAGTLEGPDDAEVRAHVAHCAACRAEVAGFGAIVASAHPAPAPTPFASARMERAVMRSITDASRRPRMRFQPRLAAAALALSAFSGAALAMTVGGPLQDWARARFEPVPIRAQAGETSRAPAPSTAERAAPTDATSAAAPAQEALIEAGATDPGASPVAAPASPVPPPVSPPKRAERAAAGALEQALEDAPLVPTATPRLQVARADGTETPRAAADAARRALADVPASDPRWLDLGDLEAMAGRPGAALDAYVRALGGPLADVADKRIGRLLDENAVPQGAVLAALSAPNVDSAEAMRLRCVYGLRFEANRKSVLDCRAFAQAHPTHPSVRRLALAAGRTAEFRVNDLALAVDEYSRAILVSEYAGIPGTEALFARARCRAKRSETAEARADLRLFLHVQPEAIWRDDVGQLARSLGLAHQAGRR